MNRYDRRARKVFEGNAESTDELIAALPLLPPIQDQHDGQMVGRVVLGGLGMVLGHALDAKRMARQAQTVPQGATVPIDGSGLFVIVSEHWVDVHRGAKKPGERLMRTARTGSTVVGHRTGFNATETWWLTLSLSNGEVVIGHTPGDGFRRQIRRFLESLPASDTEQSNDLPEH